MKGREFALEVKTYDNRWRILPIILLGPLMSTLDSSIVNVALPVMSTQLNAGLNNIQWIVTSYLIVISAFILIFGKIADSKGKTLVFEYGFVVFGVGSLLCSISKNLSFLVFSRIFQAIGASMFLSSNQGIIASIFPTTERGRALGLSGTTVALGTMLGPAIGGFMVELWGWESIFLINVPIAIIGFFIGKGFLPRESHTEKLTNFDSKGSAFFIIFISALFFAIIDGENVGWTNKSIILSFLISLVSFILFYLSEKKAANPMLNLSLFHNLLFDIGLFSAFISFLAMFSMNIIHPFYLQYIIKASPGKAGMFMMVSPICVAVIAPISGYMSDKIGAEFLTFLGLLGTALGLFLMSFLTQSSSYIRIISTTAVIGIGNGLFQSPNNSIIMSCVSKDKLGIAGSINALVRNMGMVSGIAFSVALLYNRMSHKLGHKITGFIRGENAAFLYGMKVVYIFAALICLMGILLTAFRLIKRKLRAK